MLFQAIAAKRVISYSIQFKSEVRCRQKQRHVNSNILFTIFCEF